ncbi:hypothetical protein [Catenovulum sediminis]|uniref:Uncharacterized protein n=1 Tax=Catenovulum sediminis TaxID=1740262 RepID=A0ABV1RFM0_9ALTE
MDDEMNTFCINRRRNAPLLKFAKTINKQTTKGVQDAGYINWYRFGKK